MGAGADEGEGWGEGESGDGARGTGRAFLMLALVIRPLTKHPLRDGAPFLLLAEYTYLQHLAEEVGFGGEERARKKRCGQQEARQ